MQGGIMTFNEIVSSRRSIRAYTDKPVSDEQILQLLRWAHMAPSGGNLCPWEFIVIRDPDQKKAVTKTTYRGNDENAAPQDWIEQAPVVIAVCGNPGKIMTRYGAKTSKNIEGAFYQDIGALVENFLLGAVELGLASCYVIGFRDAEIAQALRLTEGIVPVALLPLGYAAQPSQARPRAELETIIFNEYYG